MEAVYRDRLEALDQTWRRWAELGAGLTDEQWSTATRCSGWDVAALYAHHSAYPVALDAPPPLPAGPVGEPVTAVEILARFNTPDGLAHTMAATISDQAISDAAQHTRKELVERFSGHGPRALQRLRRAEATLLVPWPATGAVIMVVEALRIAVLEASVHLLDLQHALGHPPGVPIPALKDTAQLLAELAPAVEFIEAATGRSPHSPLPVLN